MHWIDGEAAWEAQAVAIEAAHELVEAGRLCCAVGCMARSEIAVPVEVPGQDGRGLRWTTGFCLAHAQRFVAEHADAIRGVPRRLEPREPLHGPGADEREADGDDEAEGTAS